jgi:hypothetical protein
LENIMLTPNYSLENLAERAQAALEHHREYVDRLEKAYIDRQALRAACGCPALAIVGMGRAGKDTAGEYLAQKFNLAPCMSSSLNALPLVAHMIGLAPEYAYAERHQNREFWIEACNQLRKDDLTRLARWCLGVCDLAVGLRGKWEFAAVMENGVCDLSVWVHRDVPKDPTVEFTREDCDVVIDNTTTFSRFYDRLDRFGTVVYGNEPNK